MSNKELGVSVLVLASVVGMAEAAPRNGDVFQAVQVSAADQVHAQTQRSQAQLPGKGSDGHPAEKSKAAPNGPGLQFHRYPPR